MNLKLTGRVLDWFCKDIASIKTSLRAQPNGLWSYPETGVGKPLYFRLPHPLHPLETIAAMRGMGCIEEDKSREQFHSDERIVRAMIARHSGWLALTEHIAQYLFVAPATVRLVWHALTPMNVPETPTEFDGTLATVTKFLYESAEQADGQRWKRDTNGPLRTDFWTHELTGDVEL